MQRRRQFLDQRQRGGDIAAIGREGDDVEHAQGRIDNHPATSRGDGVEAVGRVNGDGAVKRAHRRVEVPEKTNARRAVGDALFALVLRIEADPEKRRLLVVENVASGQRSIDRRARMGIGGGREKTQDEIAPGDRVEGKARIGAGALPEPRRRIAGRKGNIGSHGASSNRRRQGADDRNLRSFVQAACGLSRQGRGRDGPSGGIRVEFPFI